MKSSPFQIIVIAVFIIFIVIGLVALYLTRSGGGGDKAVEVTLWGTAPGSYVNAVAKATGAEKLGIKINYKEISADSFDQRLIEVLASDRGPDAIILPQDGIVRHQDKLYPIPYKTLSERTFKDSYVGEAELFLSPWGVLGVPFSIDPLVAYWNRDMFSNAGFSSAPRYWSEFLRLSESMTLRSDDNVSIKKSAVSLGEFSNITNAKEIISAMAMQGGVIFTARDSSGKLKNMFGQGSDFTSVIDFYVEFANPVKAVYTWSKSLPNSYEMFGRGDLGVYFGFASELPLIKKKNPNLDFDVTYFPQTKEGATKMTFGKVFAIAVLKSSNKASSAINLATIFGSQAGVKAWSNVSGLPPVRRDLLSSRPSSASGAVFYDSALWSRGWLDPSPSRTKEFFRDMIEGITSGWMKTNEATAKFGAQMSNLLSGQ